MAFFRIEQEQQLKLIASKSFAELGIKERQDLQALLRDNPAAIAHGLFVFSEEFSNWQDSNRRVDLLALDKSANLVVIELKRVEEGGHMELQALRYAAMLSTVDFPQVVEAYAKLLTNSIVSKKRNTSPEQAEQKLMDFLGVANSDEVIISSTPRIILMAPSFSKEITTTILWLNERGLDIRCLSVEPYDIEGSYFLEIEQVIPLPSAIDYVVQKREKEAKAEKQAVTQKRRARSLPTLIAAGKLVTGDILELTKLPRGIIKSVPLQDRYAELLDENRIKWKRDGNEYSLSSLCAAVCAEFSPGNMPVNYPFAGPDYWSKQGDTISLAELAKALDSDVLLGDE